MNGDTQPAADTTPAPTTNGLEQFIGDRGRVLHVKDLTPLETMRMAKGIPNDLQRNQMWMMYAVVAASVRQIDDIPVPMPRTPDDCERLVGQLGDDMEILLASVQAKQAMEVDLAKN